MADTPATPAAAPAAPQPAPASAVVPAAPAPIPVPATGEQLIPVVGLRPVMDPGDSYPLGSPHGTTPAPVPPGAVIEGEV